MANEIAELNDRGYCVLKGSFDTALVKACSDAFRPVLLDHIRNHEPNRGPHRFFIAMPFYFPCFATEFFFNREVLTILKYAMDDRIVADQWGCDVSFKGSQYQGLHADFQRPLFAETPDLLLPPYMLVVNFGLVPIVPENGAIEIAPGTHRKPREDALRAVQAGDIALESVSLDIGDILIRHPWALHRGTPNVTEIPRPLVGIRYVRRWYADTSREVNAIHQEVWAGLSTEQQNMLRFPVLL